MSSVLHHYDQEAARVSGQQALARQFDKGTTSWVACPEARDWAIEQGYSDPARFAILGGSYGGYAVLTALAWTPESLSTTGSDFTLRHRNVKRWRSAVLSRFAAASIY